MKVVQIGCGKMGEMWVNSFYKNGADIISIIDPDKTSKKVADKIGCKYRENLQEDDFKADLWIIATPKGLHKEYLEKAVKKEVPTVFVEKPSTSNTETSKDILNSKTSETQIYVDYIELEHEAVKLVAKDMIEENFNPTHTMHWRGKYEDKRIRPCTRNELVHDFSEVFYLYKKLGFDFESIEVKNAHLEKWDQYSRFEGSPNYKLYDISSTVLLEGSRGENILLKADFNDKKERRYFCWVDKENEVAYLVNTLSNNNLKSFVSKIRGSKNIDRLMYNCMSGNLTEMEHFDDLFSNVNAEKLLFGVDKFQDYYISNKLINRKPVTVSLQEAIQIESAVEKVYNKSKINKMYDKETL